MEQRYLPSTPQQRLQDLMKEHKIAQTVLAKKIGVTESTLSRFINGTKDTLSLDQMIGIARIFNVSTDFLLCMTDVPDRKNYDISELGLSAEAARNLYTGRANPQVVSRLLENRRFAQLTNMIALFLMIPSPPVLRCRIRYFKRSVPCCWGQEKSSPMPRKRPSKQHRRHC